MFLKTPQNLNDLSEEIPSGFEVEEGREVIVLRMIFHKLIDTTVRK